MAQLIPFTATARLQQGAALDPRFGVAFDGLLASLIRGRAKSLHGVRTGSELDGGTHAATPEVIELPLTKCVGGPWHWNATTAYPLDHSGAPFTADPDVHYIRYSHQREIAEQVAISLPKHTPISQGRFRARRLPVIVQPARYIQFRGVGDPQTIRDLLSDCHALGAHRGTGEGHVLEWDVATDPATDADRWAHTHLDGTLGRPVPTQCAQRLALTGAQGQAGLRPPYWHPANQHPVVLPKYPEAHAHATS